MKAEYREIYNNLYQKHWWWRSREVILTELLQKILPPLEHQRTILDIGGGEELFMRELSALGKVHGCEPSMEVDIETEFGPVYAAPIHSEGVFPDNTYDLTLLLDVIEHVEDDVSLLTQARRVTKPDGLLLITVPAYQSLWTAHDDDNHHVRRYNPVEFKRTLEASKLQVQQLGALFGWSAIVKFIMSIVGKITGREFRGSGIPPIWFNELLRLITIQEGRAMLRVGGVIGSSLYAVCRP